MREEKFENKEKPTLCIRIRNSFYLFFNVLKKVQVFLSFAFIKYVIFESVQKR
jgi:hypothetical protein